MKIKNVEEFVEKFKEVNLMLQELDTYCTESELDERIQFCDQYVGTGPAKIHVYTGIKALAKHLGVEEVFTEKRDDNTYPTVKYFDLNGVHYFELMTPDKCVYEVEE